MPSWPRIRDLLQQALELDPSERPAFVERQAADEAERAELRRLIAHVREEDTFLQTPGSERLRGALVGAATLREGERIGGYTIERLLGRGGMGAVYAARQERPARTVALKVLEQRLGEDALRRFEAEAEILGRLQHPGIAAIHELGFHQTPHGARLAFLAMERVEGARDLVRHAEEERLPLAERLRLFRSVCAAVHHAHQRGVIHRDLKPGNLLVDAAGRAKVIDYGVARVLDPGVAEGVETQAGMVFGTLQYMSPEQFQLDRRDVDVRSDVYSLGVVLYELVAGRLPYRLQGHSLTEVVREVCEETPPPPSAAVPALPRELDWIVLRALAKERERRYDSAQALAEDLERLERGEPVAAGPPTSWYRFTKFVARHRLSVAAAALAVLSLVGGAVASTLALVEARERRAEAEQARAAEAREADAARTALRRQTAIASAVQNMIRSVSPDQDGRKVTLFSILERSHSTFAELEEEPEVRAELLRFLGNAYSHLGLFQRAEEVLEQGLEALERVERPDRALRGSMRASHAQLRSLEQDYDGAERELALAMEDMAATGRLDESEGLEARRLQAILLEKRGRLEEALAVYGAAAEEAEARLGPGHPLAIHLLAESGALTAGLGDVAEAERRVRLAYERANRHLGPEHSFTLPIAIHLGSLLEQQGRLEEALAIQEQAVAGTLEAYGPSHRNSIVALQALASAYLASGRAEYAEGVARQALETTLESHPDDVEPEVIVRLVLARSLVDLERADEATEVLEEALRRMAQGGLDRHPRVVELRTHLSQLQVGAGRIEEAVEMLRPAVAVARETLPPTHARRLEALTLLGRALIRLGRLEEAGAELGAAYEALEASDDPRAAGLARGLAASLAEVARGLGRAEEAAAWEARQRRP